jgi:hypothetical protein
VVALPPRDRLTELVRRVPRARLTDEGVGRRAASPLSRSRLTAINAAGDQATPVHINDNIEPTGWQGGPELAHSNSLSEKRPCPGGVRKICAYNAAVSGSSPLPPTSQIPRLRS